MKIDEPTVSGNRYIIAATDHFSKYVEARAVKGEQGMEVARFIKEQIIERHGCPLEIVSDRGQAFLSHAVELIYEWAGVNAKRTVGYHPACNGAAEATNGM